MKQGPRLRDPSIDQKMRDLSNIYGMYCKTTGQDRAMWCDKWYALVKQIAVEIRRMRRESNNGDTF